MQQHMEDSYSELDRGLNIAGIGWYNFKFCLLLYLSVLSSIFELNGYSMIMPAAKCDLQMSDKQRGVVVALPYVAIILTAFPHGYLIDTQGRKKPLIYSSFIAGIFSALAGFMPNLTSFTICKFITSLCLAAPVATPFIYIGEIVPVRHRDLLITLATVGQISGAAMVPFLSWVIRPMDFKLDFGIYTFQPWRLLNAVYASVLIVTGFLLILVPESPKFLLYQGRPDDALKILQNIYTSNTKKPLKEFAVKSLRMPSQGLDMINLEIVKTRTITLLKWKYLKYLLLNGFLLFGVFAILNGLHVWVPDLMTRVFTNDVQGQTACQVIMHKYEIEITGTKCDDSYNKMVFIINSCAQLACSVVALALTMSVHYIGKKNLLHILYYVMGSLCVFVNHIRDAAVFTVIVISLPIMNIATGAVKAYAVQMFPNNLRGTALCLCVIGGRLGSVFASVIIGVLLDEACVAMFNVYGGLLFICGTLTFFYAH